MPRGRPDRDRGEAHRTWNRGDGLGTSPPQLRQLVGHPARVIDVADRGEFDLLVAAQGVQRFAEVAAVLEDDRGGARVGAQSGDRGRAQLLGTQETLALVFAERR